MNSIVLLLPADCQSRAMHDGLLKLAVALRNVRVALGANPALRNVVRCRFVGSQSSKCAVAPQLDIVCTGEPCKLYIGEREFAARSEGVL